ncbi:MAG: nitroreductase family protein [Spirochaetota bacterium]|jgi:hypothetical protein|nr:nitroreductase family protein [Spirochaetota bacterium]
MQKRNLTILIVVICILVLGVLYFSLCARDSTAQPAPGAADVMVLPKPDTQGGMPLMQALSLRKSGRDFSNRAITEQELSDLLWACCGVNRADGHRTPPFSQNRQLVEVYVTLESGVYRYDAPKHQLVRELAGDMRSRYGAPLTLIFAADSEYYASGMHVGSLYQNVGLYCASVGLANVVKRNGVDALDGLLKLPPGYRVFIVQSLGYPR